MLMAPADSESVLKHIDTEEQQSVVCLLACFIQSMMQVCIAICNTLGQCRELTYGYYRVLLNTDCLLCEACKLLSISYAPLLLTNDH